MPKATTVPDQLNLSRRERQIMDILYREGRAAAGEVLLCEAAARVRGPFRSGLR